VNLSVRMRAALACAAAAFAAFVALAWTVSSGRLSRLDGALLVGFRNARDPQDPLGPTWLESVMHDVTSLGSFSVLGIVVLIVYGFLWLNGKRHGALLVLISAASGAGLSTFLKAAFERERPALVTHLAEVSSASFPSGHAMLSATLYLTLGVLIARVQRRPGLRIYPILVAIALTVLIGVSRLYLGVHWPSDVAGGWLIGTGWALLCYVVAVWLQKRGMLEGKPPPESTARSR
jgi:undecaprenyl-diphosphatase